MSGGQIAALIFAILLLLPGGCFLIMGIGFATDENHMYSDAAPVLLVVAAAMRVCCFGSPSAASPLPALRPMARRPESAPPGAPAGLARAGA